MRRFFVSTSFLLLTSVITTFLDDPATAIVPRKVAILLISSIVGCWVFGTWLFFRSAPMSKREVVASFLVVGFVICALLGTDEVISLAHGKTTWLATFAWHLGWIGLAAAFLVTMHFLIPERPIPEQTPYTVESESPDHVISRDKSA